MMLAVILLTVALGLSCIGLAWMHKINKAARNGLAKLTDNIRGSYQNPRIVIIALNYQQAMTYVRAWKMNPRRVIVASSKCHLWGLTDVLVFRVGQWRQRDDLREIDQWVEMARALNQLHGEIDCIELARPSHG